MLRWLYGCVVRLLGKKWRVERWDFEARRWRRVCVRQLRRGDRIRVECSRGEMIANGEPHIGPNHHWQIDVLDA